MSGLPPIPAFLFRLLTPHAERREVLGDLAAEYAQHVRARGRLAARVWLWRQAAGSVPALLRRGWWRGWSGFEPEANRMQPGGPMFESWIMDLRFSARRLSRRPGYAALAVLTLALGAGGTAAIVSILREVMVEPLPMRDEHSVGILWFGGSWNEQEFVSLRPQFPGFERMAAYRPLDATLEVPGRPLRLVRGITSSAELFEVLGAAPALGRVFQAGDDLQGAQPVAVLSHGLWQDLGADPAILGQPLSLGGVPHSVVGVMPPGFWFPNPTVRVWTSTALRPDSRSGMYTLVGRLEKGRAMESMQGPLAALARTLGERFQYMPQWDKTRSPSVSSVREFLIGDMRASLLATFVAMALILGIACVNVAALMLGQLGGRSTEMAVRAALGAGRRRLMQQLVMEALLIGAAAGAAGAALAAGGFRVLKAALPLGALAESAELDWTIFWAAVATALAAASLTALVPGLAIWRADPQRGLASSSRTVGVSARGGRLEAGLVVGQIGLAVLLASGAGLLLRSVVNLRSIDPGCAVAGVAVVDATLPAQISHDQRRLAILEMTSSLASLPGVKAAGAVQKLPLRGSGDNWGLTVDGKPEMSGTTTAFRLVTHEYLRAMGARLVAGRLFEAATDRRDTEMVVVVNEAMAAKYFPGEDPIGRVIRTSAQVPERIIGVVGDMAEAALTDAAVPARYVLFEQIGYTPSNVSFVLAGERESDVPALLAAARGVVTGSPRMALQQTTTMESVFEHAVGAPGRVSSLLVLLSGLALALGAVGVYGVISHSVARRRRDFAVRIALGLPPARVTAQVIGRGLRLAVMGSALGVAATLVSTRPLASLLYGVGGADPAALSGAALALVAVGAAAAFVPAWRAGRTDPAVVLRQE
ncbi:MAG TPA: ADOP family duplicated permease [Candidatus Polarisedimenticolia bacterium]|nr:ADOP family duplicated permease [Candidatus Polarisedimenticolia bacterium]